MFTRFRIIAPLIALALVQPAEAGGFYVSELGTPGSLGTAGVANATNTFGADSAWTNPAGMTGVKQDAAVVGMQLIVPKVEFDSSVATGGGDDGHNAGVFSVVPSHFLVKTLSDNVKLGFSIAGTMGGGLDYGKNFVGRYAAYRAVLAGVALSPSIAYKLNDDLSVGAGASVVYTAFDEKIAVRQPGNANGSVHIDQIDDWGFTTFFGLTYRLSEKALAAGRGLPTGVRCQSRGQRKIQQLRWSGPGRRLDQGRVDQSAGAAAWPAIRAEQRIHPVV